MAKRKNIIFYFSDQQRWDTVNETVTPNLMQLAKEGTLFENNFTCQPVCGPARACLQTGVYATQCGCYWNGIPLPESITPLAHYFNEAGYDTAYVGKWHLASDRLPGIGTHCEATPVPKEKQGEYRYWRAAVINAQILELLHQAAHIIVQPIDGGDIVRVHFFIVAL